MGKRKPKPPGTCIFCGRTGLSKEHIWSDWLKELIPRNTTHGEWSEGFEYDFEEKKFTGMRPLMEMTRQGCMTQCKIRNVCEAHCNNGWMGRAVEAAKPIASNLITGQMCKVDEGGVRSLATWLAITTVMQEFTVTRTVMIPPEDRAELMHSNAPPEHWSMWIGYYGGEDWTPMGHLHVPVTLSKRVSENDGTESYVPNCDLQITSFAIRHLLTHVFTATNVGMVNKYREFIRDQNWNLVQIWPIIPSIISWPRFPILDGELRLIAHEFARVNWRVPTGNSFGRKNGV